MLIIFPLFLILKTGYRQNLTVLSGETKANANVRGKAHINIRQCWCRIYDQDLEPKGDFKMQKSSPKKPKKSQGFGNPISVLISVTLLGTFAVFAPFNVSFFDSININRILPSFYTPNSLSIIPEPSFTSDQNYWDENCTHGWTSDVTCDAIVSRVQSCLVNNSSLYCSAYETYMKKFLQQHPLLLL
jgi:hypothetical protein